ncbi:HDOD domain-containing protein [uncultured Marinobacter sp.]|uniref:HDOD domain-containing protein n=1 Tax=uncultured Marinobacter sp. TaxID=187379 RepID=UPI0030DBA703
MALAAKVEQFLNRKGVSYDLLPVTNQAGSSFDSAVMARGGAVGSVIRCTAMIDLKGVILVVHPYDSSPDADAIERHTGRRFQPLTAAQTNRLFADCLPGFVPPFGAAYGVPVLVEQALLEENALIMACGGAGALMVLSGRNFRLGMAGCDRGTVTLRQGGHQPASGITLEEIAEKLQKLYRLPPMPALALRILRLTGDSDASVRELAELIEFDPSLTAQVIRYARSALFNYPGQVESVHEAVTRVLGFDRVAHIAVGIASVRAFDIPRQGVLGMDQFWRHSLYTAFLTQRMAPHCDADPGLAYLCGLLHNFGLLLVGHLFPAEFAELNRLREANPEASMRALEDQVFGNHDSQQLLTVGHGVIGGILHKLWELPGAVVKAAGMHQQLHYQGDHRVYVVLVQLANGLLKEIGVGDEFNPDDLQQLAAEAGIDPAQLDEFRKDMAEVAEDLDSLAYSLAS